MSGPDERVLDLYAPLSHKTAFGVPLTGRLTPSWVPADARRRLVAYRVLAASLGNVSRWYLDADSETRDGRREFGDPALLVDRVAVAVLGDDPQISVDGVAVPAVPEIGDPPDAATGATTPIGRRVADVAAARWERDATEIVDAWEAAVAAQPALAERERWLRAWADTDSAQAKLARFVRLALGYGDGAATVMWDPDTGRPTVRVIDPGFFFPVDVDDNGTPRRVHLAWEETRPDPSGGARQWVRRLTWELVPIGDTYAPGESVRDGDTLDEAGVWRRRYPWTALGEPGSPLACVYSDGEWPLTDLDGSPVDAFPGEPERVDLGLDFVPVYHLQGRDIGDEFGESILSRVSQLLDEMASSDSDISAASAIAAGPAVALSGATLAGDVTVAPGVVWQLGPDGRMDVLDLSAGLAELRARGRDLEDRFSVNAQTPAEVLGRVTGADGLSGVAIGLRLGPFRQLVQGLRLSHLPVLSSVVAAVQRVAQANGALDPGPVPVARVAAGPFLPSDLAGAVQMVAAGRVAGVVSEEQAVDLLSAAGMSHRDRAGEVARIREADPGRAKLLFEATGNEAASAGWAGVDPGPPGPDPGLGL